MVFYYLSGGYMIYMGKHKEENEDLIKYGWPEDVWFHVDDYSSAHVYMRLKPGDTIDTIPPNVLEDCCQLVKANSIEGNKVNNVTIVYTPWTNLKKTNDMAVGQVGFHDAKLVKKYHIEKRQNQIINRLNKTKEEKFPNLAEEKAQRDREEREKAKADLKKKKEAEKQQEAEKRRQAELKSYSSLFEDQTSVKTNAELQKMNLSAKDYEEDFI
jgi:hypothetical protein